MIKRNGLTPLLYIVCGVLCALPLSMNKLWFLAWIAYVPIVFNELTRLDDNKKAYKKAWLRGLFFFIPFGITTFSWAVSVYPLDFVGLTPAQAIGVISMGIIGLPVLQGICSAFNIVLLTYLKKNKVKTWMWPLAAGFTWVVFEWLQTLTWAGIPWGKLAVGQVGVLQNLQSSSLLGPYFVSFIIIVFNACVAIGLGYLKHKDFRKRAISFLCTAALIFGSNFLYGVLWMDTPLDYKNEFKVAAIQANIGTVDKWNGDQEASMKIHKELIKQANNDGAELVVMAETNFPYALKGPYLYEEIKNLMAIGSADMIIGCYTHEKGNSYNSTVYISDEEGITDNIYRKQKLVPFGEFVPAKSLVLSIMPFLEDLNLFKDDISPGYTSSVMETKFGKIGSIICFDSIYENIPLNSVKNGAKIITISTNDAWFGDSDSVYEHNAQARLRAIELGRYVVRAGNTGISSIITDKGEVLQQLEPQVEGYIVDTVKTTDTRTIYSKVGNVIVFIAFLFIGFVILTVRANEKKREAEKAKQIEEWQRKKREQEAAELKKKQESKQGKKKKKKR